MTPEQWFPDEPAGPFPTPPETFEDKHGRTTQICQFGTARQNRSQEEDGLVKMYVEFDPGDRAQGIPPAEEGTIRDWLELVLTEEAVNVLAWHNEAVIGHGMLVPDGNGAFELAIFVDQVYQGAGIGSRLIRCLLGAGAAAGVSRVWLTVERWNRIAINLYKTVGFETADTEGFELEMTLWLNAESTE